MSLSRNSRSFLLLFGLSALSAAAVSPASAAEVRGFVKTRDGLPVSQAVVRLRGSAGIA
jgi:hypothetical protein